MPKPLDYYKQRFHEINDALIQQIDAVEEDGYIDYEEAVSTKALSADVTKELNALKKELNLALREIRAGYQLQINNAATWKKKHLRREKTNALAPFERMKLLVDEQLLNVSNVKDYYSDAIEEIGAMAQEEPPEEAQQDETEDDAIEIPIEDIQALITRWQGLMGNIDRELAASKSVKKTTEMKGMKRILGIVLEEINELVEV